jgi:hypothetical protein
MKDVLVADAVDLDFSESDVAYAEIPTAPVTWPDGRVDILPHTCTSQDVGPEEILRDHPALHLGFVNRSAGMTSGYDSADLVRLRPDVCYSRVGDVLWGEWSACYLRGPVRTVTQYWLDRIVNYMMPPSLPWAELILCTHYGLLAESILSEFDRYEVNLFLESPDEDMAGMVIDFNHSLPGIEMAILIRMLEDNGCTWPRHASTGDLEAATAWAERVRRMD